MTAPADDCLFCKFADGRIKPATVYEDEEVLAFRDINPQAPTHVLIIPRKHVASVDQAVIIDWCNKRGITFQRFMNDQSLINSFLDDPDNSSFRIWKGRV